jgi:Ni/Fe-hydrogenase 1 B-type cytochrome subunit
MDLLKINIWLDVLFPLIWGVIGVGLAFHFIMSIVTGRFHKSFIEGIWPEHEERAPALPKFLHAQHMFMMIILAITGMAIRFPTFSRPWMRGLHYFAMTVVIVNLVVRVWYAFFAKERDWQEFAIRKKDAVTLIGVAKFYAYLSNKKPHVAKYNVMQKGTYLMFFALMIVQAFTGLALLTMRIPLIGMSPRDMLVGWWLGALVGSTDLAGWYMRTIHYIINWVFILVTTIHVYLSATIDIPVTMDFFGIKELQVKPHGHAPEPAPQPITVSTGPAES